MSSRRSVRTVSVRDQRQHVRVLPRRLPHRVYLRLLVWDAGGLQAELSRIPLADGSLVKVPGIDPATAGEGLLASLLTLSDVYLTGYYAAHMGQAESGKTVTAVGGRTTRWLRRRRGCRCRS